MAAKQRKVIITCAATGSIHTPTMSPHIPLTPSEIAEQSIEAAEAGAAIIHLHARNPEDGSPTPSPDVFMEFLPRIKQSCKAVVNITTGGGHGMTLEERLAGAMRTKPEMSSLNMGSMNFGLFPMLDRYPEFKYEWERKHLENSRDFIFRNTFKDIEYILRASARRTAPASSSSATTSGTSTTSPTSSTGGSSGRHCSCRRFSASSAASARIRKTSCT